MHFLTQVIALSRVRIGLSRYTLKPEDDSEAGSDAFSDHWRFWNVRRMPNLRRDCEG